MISDRGCMWLRAVSISAKGRCLVFLCGLRVPKTDTLKSLKGSDLPVLGLYPIQLRG